MGAAGDKLQPVRVAFVELKKGADLVASKQGIVIGDRWGLVSIVLGSEGWPRCWTLACRRVFKKANFMLWTGMLTTHAVVSKSRS